MNGFKVLVIGWLVVLSFLVIFALINIWQHQGILQGMLGVLESLNEQDAMLLELIKTAHEING